MSEHGQVILNQMIQMIDTYDARRANLRQLVDAFNRSRSLKKAPVVILSCTTRGFGVESLEESDELLDAEKAVAALAALGTTAEEWQRRLEASDGPGHRRRG